MKAEFERADFSRVDIVVAILSLGAIATLLAPALAQSRGNSERAQCANNASQVVAALLKFENSRRCFPLASTRPITSKPAHFGDESEAGFSWLAMVLTYLDGSDEVLSHFDKLVVASQRFAKSPYDPSVTAAAAAPPVAPREFAVPAFVCPSIAATIGETESPAKAGGKSTPVSNYHALVGSHFYNTDGVGRMIGEKAKTEANNARAFAAQTFEGNGAIPFPSKTDAKPVNGVKMSQITDGASATIVFAESMEHKYSAWLDGQVTWLVAAWPGNPDLPEWLPNGRPPQPPVIGWKATQLATNWTSLGKQWSPAAAKPSPAYLPASRWSAGEDRVWGPSSPHGGLVTHAFADGGVHMIRESVDKNVYLQLVTRDGREVVDRDKVVEPAGQ